MSNPVYVDFVVRGLSKTLKAMQSISDVVNKTERQSTAAAKAGQSTRQRVLEQEARDKIAAYKRCDAVVEASHRSNSKLVEKRAKAERESVAQTAREKIAAYKKADAIVESAHKAHSKKLEKESARVFEASRKASHDGAMATAKGWISASDKVAQGHAKIARQLDVEKKNAHFEIARGAGRTKDPALSAQARLALLHSADGKSPEQRQKILDQARVLRSKGQESRREDAADHKAAEAKKTRALESAEKSRLAIRERSASMAGQYAKKQADKEEREARRATRDSQRQHAQFVNTAMGGIGNAASSAMTIGGKVVSGLAGAVTGLGGGFSVQGALQDRVNLEKQAALLSNASVTPDHPNRIDPKDIVGRVKAASISTGTDASELMAGLSAYTAKSADYEGGASSLDFFGKVAKSTGSSLESVMRTAGTMRVQNKDLKPDDMKQLLLSTVMQARQGSVEFEDMARAGGKITRTAGMYTGSQAENQRKLLGLSQIGMKTSGNDVSEAATNLANLQSDAINHKAELAELLGRKSITNSEGRLEGGPDKLIGDLMEAAMGKEGGINHLAREGGDGKHLFGARSMKMFQAVLPTYTTAKEDALKAGASKADAHKAGAAEVRKEMSTTIATKYDEKDLEKDFATVMKTSAEQFEGAVRQLKTEVGKKLLPELLKFIPILQQLTPLFADVLKGMASLARLATENPFEALGATVGLFLMKELVQAEIGNTLKAISTSASAASGSMGAVNTAAAGAAGSLALLGVGLAAQAAALGYYADQLYGAQKSGKTGGEKDAMALVSGTPAERAAAGEAQAAAASKSGTGRQVLAYGDYASRALQLAVNPMGGLAELGGTAAAQALGGKTSLMTSNETIENKTRVSTFNELISNGDKLAEVFARVAVAAGSIPDIANAGSDKRGKSIAAPGRLEK